MLLNRYAAGVMFELGHGWRVEPLQTAEIVSGAWDYRLKITRLCDGVAKYVSTRVAPMAHVSDRAFCVDAANKIRRSFPPPPPPEK